MGKILITGATGMLGAALVADMASEYEIYATAGMINPTHLGNASYFAFDLTNEDYAPLQKFCKPDIVIHCAALTDLRLCAQNPTLAHEVNAKAVQKLAKAFSQSYFIHISTEAVFHSAETFPSEKIEPLPQTAYGISKRDGEVLLQEMGVHAAILRTTVVGFGGHRRTQSLAEWIVAQAKANKSFGLYTDSFFTPISVWDLARVIRLFMDKKPCGIYHTTGTETLSKYNFGMALLTACGLSSENAYKSQVQAGNNGARTDQSLDCSLFEQTFSIHLPDAKQCIASFATHYGDYYE